MNFFRTFVSPSNESQHLDVDQDSPSSTHLEIVDDEDNAENSLHRKRFLRTSTSSTNSDSRVADGITAFQPKRRKIGSSSSLLGNIFAPLRQMSSWLGVSSSSETAYEDSDGDDDDVIELPSENERSRNKNVSLSPRGRFDFPQGSGTNAVIDISSEDNSIEDEDNSICVLSVKNTPKAKPVETISLSSPRRSPRNHSGLTRNGQMPVLPSTPVSRPVSVMEVQPDEEEDEIAVVGEVTRSPGGGMAATRRSVEIAMRDVISASSSRSQPDEEHDSLVAAANERLKRFTSDVGVDESPARSESLSIVTNNDLRVRGSPSPGPEDSASRQHTPKGYYGDAAHTTRSDSYSRRSHRTPIRTGSKPRFSMERATERFLREINTANVESSPINLLARDRYKALITSASQADTSNRSHLVTRNKTERKLKRLDAHDDLYRRARMALLKISNNRSTNDSITPSRSASGQDTETIVIGDTEPEVVTLDDTRPSPCDTPGSVNSSVMSCSSVGRSKLDDLLVQMRSVQLRDTDVLREHKRYLADDSHDRRRELALAETSRVGYLSRKLNRAEIEAQTRETLALSGIRLPPPKPKLKDEFPPLPEEALDVCNRAWRRGQEGEVFCKGFDQPITRKDLLTLSGLNWLNDEIINCYLQLICDRSKKDETLPKVYAFNTFFYTNVNTKGYASVKRWTRKVDIFSFDVLLVPVHMNNNHWCMAVIDMSEKKIEYYDSMHGRNQRCLDNLKAYLESESMDKKKTAFDPTGWSFNIRSDCPEQMNGSDCGMFACKFAEFASRRLTVSFNQSHMPYYRKRMVFEIAQMELM